MHSRNRYKDRKPDFVQLARAHPPLEKQLIKKGDDYATLDFRDPKSQRELTVALLKHDFNLSVDIPLDKLIPTVPQKLNYIHWIEDLLAGCNNGCIPRGPEVVGIDVGEWALGSPLSSTLGSPMWFVVSMVLHTHTHTVVEIAFDLC